MRDSPSGLTRGTVQVKHALYLGRWAASATRDGGWVRIASVGHTLA